MRGAGRSFGWMGRLAAAASTLAGLCVAAHGEPTAELASSPAKRCLAPAVEQRVKPAYPTRLYEIKQGGTFDAEFEFTAPDRPPRVRLQSEPPEEFQDAIEAYARQLRVPCMSPRDAPVKLRQTFVFTPNDGRKVAWTTPADVADAAREEQMKCIVRPAPDALRYPAEMLRRAREGTVVARVRFTDAAAAPTYEVLTDGGDRTFAKAVGAYIEQLRLPCPSGGVLEVNYTFDFRIEGGGNSKRLVLKDLPLAAFLGAVKPIPAGSAYFDTNTMKCPFDVRLTFEQPFEPNRIEELEEDVPARHPLLDWLGEREFNLDRKTAAEVLHQQMIIHVPCVKIDL